MAMGARLSLLELTTERLQTKLEGLNTRLETFHDALAGINEQQKRRSSAYEALVVELGRRVMKLEKGP